MTKHVPLADFEEQCVALLENVIATGEAVLITKDGEAVASVISMRGPMHGTVKILGDIEVPLDVEWDVMK